MVRETSWYCYQQIKKEGLLQKDQMEAYEHLKDFGPMTSGELHRDLYLNTRGVAQTRSRLAELKDKGVVSEIGKRRCGVSGRHSYILQTNDNLPKDFKKPKSKNQIIDILTLQRNHYIKRLYSNDSMKANIAIKECDHSIDE